ncbi:MAG TPA: 1-(5-phosphoribosyl)-5-[(5-phosphoribosylamino)methylideneamino]imidazole-4-carboxamide isomerase [Candidatus Binataceae bacterium]|nr:1-(5-phosphoribosyl)-5-[(5-phosphoribosylamino)methylideneamino]imidazole-4-carboxamide isomerase [Candidatus Binataceae bacterium]
MLFDRFTVIPAIDLKDGKVVRLMRGEMDRATLYETDPAKAAREFENQGAKLIHVVDLDGAVAGEPRNRDAIAAIRAAVRCEIDASGGLRTIESVRTMIRAGADRISIGSAAFLNPALLKQACDAFPGRVFGSLDVRGGMLAIKGWKETSALTVAKAADRFRAAGVAAITVTDISRDGTQSGIDASAVATTARETRLPTIASGGVATLDDIRALRALFADGVVGVIVGRALYERRFTLAEAIAASV